MDPVEPWIDGDAVRRLAAQLLSKSSGTEIADSPDAGFGPGFEGFTEARDARDVIREPRLEALVPSQLDDTPVVRPTSEPPPFQNASATAPSPTAAAVKETPGGNRREEVPPSSGTSEAKPFLPDNPPSRPSPVSESPGDQPFRAVSKSPARAAKPSGEARHGPLMERMTRFREWFRRHSDAKSVFILDREGQPVLDDPAFAKLHFLARSLSQAYRPIPGQPGNVHVKVGSESFLVVIPVDTTFGTLVLGTVLPRPLEADAVEVVAKALKEAATPRQS